jgi:hypothetical protein
VLYTYDFTNKLIHISRLQGGNVVGQTLLSDIRDAEASVIGMGYGQIASASGGESLGGGVSVGITVNLLDSWQILFEPGTYIAKISACNLVGGLNGEPIAYSNDVQVLLLQSASSTVVTVSTGSGLSAQQDANLTAILTAANSASISAATAASQATSAGVQATKARKMQTNKAIISTDGKSVTLYEDDGATLLHTFSTPDENTRLPI